MTNLKKAREKDDLESFIKEHEADPVGDLDKLDKVIKSSTQESGSKARPASSQDASGD